MSDAIRETQSFSVHPFCEDGFACVASPVLSLAREQAQAAQLPYAGSLALKDAWALFSRGEAVLIDYAEHCVLRAGRPGLLQHVRGNRPDAGRGAANGLQGSGRF